MADQAEKRWSKEEIQMWDDGAEAVDRMPYEMKVQFAESLEALAIDARQEPEKEKLERTINNDLAKLKQEWMYFEPDEWTSDNFRDLMEQAAHIWETIETLNFIETEERKEAALIQAQAVFDGGGRFSIIEIDGFAFAFNGWDEKIRENIELRSNESPF